jgi:hypothetical protein
MTKEQKRSRRDQSTKEDKIELTAQELNLVTGGAGTFLNRITADYAPTKDFGTGGGGGGAGKIIVQGG